MTDSNSSVTTTEVGTTNENPTSGQTQEELIPKKDYTALQSESTGWRQGQIEVTAKLVSKDKSELKDITDTKLRDAVVKKLYPNYSSYEEMVAIEGTDFAPSTDEDDSSVTLLQRQIKQLSYQNEKREMDTAIEKVKAENPDAFKSDGAEDTLRAQLKNLSSTLPLGERVELAAKLAFASTIDSKTLAFKVLSGTQPTNNGSTTGQAEVKSKSENNIDSVLDFLRNTK